MLLPFASQYTDQVKKFFNYCENLLKTGEDAVKNVENKAENMVSTVDKDVNQAKSDVQLVEKNVAAATTTAYGST